VSKAKLAAVGFFMALVFFIFQAGSQSAAADANADLSTIFASTGPMSPAFSPAITEYWQMMRSNELNYYTAATTVNASATMEYSMNGGPWTPMAYYVSTGYIGTNRGDNTFRIRVTATDGTTTKEYTIHVYFPETNDAALRDLRVNDTTLSPAFAEDALDYTGSVSYTTSSVTLTGVLDDPAASLTVNGVAATSGSASAPVSLDVGPNIITVHTVSQDATADRTYTVTVTRSAPGADANLSGLTSSGGALSPAFQANQTAYTLPDASYSASSLTVIPTVVDSTATPRVRINGGAYVSVGSGIGSDPLALNVGLNTIDVEVTAQDGTTIKTYTISVKRQNNDATLSALSVSPYGLSEAFSSGVLGYTIADVPSAVSSLTVTPTLTDAAGAFVHVRAKGGAYTAVTSGFGVDVPLIYGSNTIEVEVLAEDTSIARTYTIVATRLLSSDASLQGLAVTGGNLLFSPQVEDYALSVSESTYTLAVQPVVAEPDITSVQVRINQGGYTIVPSGQYSEPLTLLNDGTSDIELLITAQDGTQRVYTLHVTHSGIPMLDHWTMTDGTLTLTFTEPLLTVSPDPSHYSLYNITRDAELPIALLTTGTGSPSVTATYSGQVLPADQIRLQIQAGAVTSAIGDSNAFTERTFFYGDPLQQMQQRLAELDTEHDGIHINDIAAYLDSPYGINDLTGDAVFDGADVAVLLDQIAFALAR